MKANEIPEQDRKCINCAYCGMYDATCTHPENVFPPIRYHAPACEHFETEELYTPNEKIHTQEPAQH